MADLGASDVEVGERDLLVAAHNHAVIEAAVGSGHPGMAAGKVEDVGAQGVGRQVYPLAGDNGARARERAGVVRGQIGVRVDDGDALPSRTKDGGGDLPV